MTSFIVVFEGDTACLRLREKDMNKTPIAKIKDNTGASLAMGLMLFLVCAVLGSIVLAAGSAAAGRMKMWNKSEQEDYALLSAADLIRAQLADAEMSVELRTTGTGSGTGTYTVDINDEDSSETVTWDDDLSYSDEYGEGTYYLNGKEFDPANPAVSPNASILEKATAQYLVCVNGENGTCMDERGTDQFGVECYKSKFNMYLDGYQEATKVNVEAMFYPGNYNLVFFLYYDKDNDGNYDEAEKSIRFSCDLAEQDAADKVGYQQYIDENGVTVTDADETRSLKGQQIQTKEVEWEANAIER